ncbi:hypothetical protein ACU6HG_004054 [Salmonella enterica]|uniref:hypothetical protein n=1 Tax=Salmonella enterica TaxID=28901 RepID=UPI001E3D793C|nr:hypothetical protein [Salmonella enterica]
MVILDMDVGLCSIVIVHYLTNNELNAWQAATGYQHVQAEWIARQESKGINDVGELMQGVSAILNKTR